MAANVKYYGLRDFLAKSDCELHRIRTEIALKVLSTRMLGTEEGRAEETLLMAQLFGITMILAARINQEEPVAVPEPAVQEAA